MPELPEVETVVRDLRELVTGQTIHKVQVNHPKPLKYPSLEHFSQELIDKTIISVERRAKFIFCTLSNHKLLIFHLGMTGKINVVDSRQELIKHTHLILDLNDNKQLRYIDPRRFGRIMYGTQEELHEAKALPVLGVEPLSTDFTWTLFEGLMKDSKRSLKATLLEQTKLVGMGNIYVDEACFLAKVKPSRACNSLTKAEALCLFKTIPVLLEEAISNRGSSVDDYRDVWNAKGKQQESLKVYGRTDKPCVVCNSPIHKTTVAGRGTHYCPNCQA